MTSRECYYSGRLYQSDGHTLYNQDGRRVLSYQMPKDFPVRPGILDGGLLPPGFPQEEGRAELIRFDGWVIVTFWDRSADKRHNSCSAFIVRGSNLEFSEVIKTAQESFPGVWARIGFKVYYRRDYQQGYGSSD